MVTTQIKLGYQENKGNAQNARSIPASPYKTVSHMPYSTSTKLLLSSIYNPEIHAHQSSRRPLHTLHRAQDLRQHYPLILLLLLHPLNPAHDHLPALQPRLCLTRRGRCHDLHPSAASKAHRVGGKTPAVPDGGLHHACVGCTTAGVLMMLDGK